MFKGLNAKLAVIVGEKASIMFQHIYYWMKTQEKDIIYRTNKELVGDLEGMFSEQQIQRAKKKLVDEGFITISFDKKNCWVRTTHYSLTDKGKKYVLDINLQKGKQYDSKSKESNNSYDSTKKDESSKFESQYKAYNKQKDAVKSQSQTPLASSKAMKDSFDEGFGNKNAVKCPSSFLDKLKGVVANKEVEITPVVEYQYSEDEDDLSCEDLLSDDYLSNEDLSFEDDHLSNEDLKILEMQSSIDIDQQAIMDEMMLSFDRVEDEKLSFNELLKLSFNSMINKDQEVLYDMKQHKHSFIEDY